MLDIDRSAENLWQTMCHNLGRKSFESQRIFDLDDDCLEAYKLWYIETKTQIIDDPTDIKTIAGARVIEHALKLALIYAILQNPEQDNLIHTPAWETADHRRKILGRGYNGDVGKLGGRVKQINLNEQSLRQSPG